MNTTEDEKKPRLLIPVLVTIAVFVAVEAAYLILLLKLLPDWQTRGQFGDLFGALNATFSGMGFLAIFYTITLQQKQIEREKESRDWLMQQKLSDDERRSTNNALEMVTFLIGYYESRIAFLEAKPLNGGPRGADVAKLIREFYEKKRELQIVIDQQHDKAISLLR